MSGESISGILSSSLGVGRHQPPTRSLFNNNNGATVSSSSTPSIDYWPSRGVDGLDYTNYFKKLEENIARLKLLWRNEQRLEALQLAVQLAKLLADTSQLKLYSKKHKMITNMLNELGELISARIKETASGQSSSPLPAPSLSGSSSRAQEAANYEQAKEMCRNWFLKVAGIPELVPKFYIELAILNICEPLLFPTNSTLTNHGADAKQNFYKQSLKRFIKTSWALADPIVALYSRAYLSSRAQVLLKMPTTDSSGVIKGFADLVSINILDSAKLVTYLDSDSVLLDTKTSEIDQWLELICSPIQSMIALFTLEATSSSPNEDPSQELSELHIELLSVVSKDTCSLLGQGIVLNATCRALPDDIIALQANRILNLLLKSQENRRVQAAHLVPVLLVPLESFAISLLASDYFEKHVDPSNKLGLFKSIESLLANLFHYCSSPTSINDSLYIHSSYFRCFKAWIYYANSYTDLKTLGSMLDLFLVQVKKNIHLTNQQVDSVVFDIIKTLIASRKTAEEYSGLFELKSIWKLIELFRRDNYKLASASWILETMKANLRLTGSALQINQTPLIDSLLKIFITLNKSLGLLMDREDIERLSSLIISYLDRILIADFRKRLNFYTKCRANLSNLNPVLIHLTKMALKLPVEFREVERKRNARQDYLNGCLAFAYVTVPAIEDTCTRLNLLIEGADLALSQLSISLSHYYWQQLLLNLKEHIDFWLLNGHNRRPKLDKPDELSCFTELEGEDEMNHDLKLILPIMKRTLNVMLKYQDHTGNEHKLTLRALISEHFQDCSSLTEGMKLLNVIKCDEFDYIPLDDT